MRLRTHPTLPHAPLDPCVHNIFIVRCEQFFSWQLGSKQKTANPGLLGVTFYLLDLIFLTSPGGCNYPEFIDGQTERLNSPMHDTRLGSGKDRTDCWGLHSTLSHGAPWGQWGAGMSPGESELIEASPIHTHHQQEQKFYLLTHRPVRTDGCPVCYMLLCFNRCFI